MLNDAYRSLDVVRHVRACALPLPKTSTCAVPFFSFRTWGVDLNPFLKSLPLANVFFNRHSLNPILLFKQASPPCPSSTVGQFSLAPACAWVGDRPPRALTDVPVGSLSRDTASVYLWCEVALPLSVHEGSLGLRAQAARDVDRILRSVDVREGV
jgi:hypothetical protein